VLGSKVDNGLKRGILILNFTRSDEGFLSYFSYTTFLPGRILFQFYNTHVLVLMKSLPA